MIAYKDEIVFSLSIQGSHRDWGENKHHCSHDESVMITLQSTHTHTTHTHNITQHNWTQHILTHTHNNNNNNNNNNNILT